MNRHSNRLCPHLPAPRRQRGTMLIIALIILVAMTLAGIGMMRSVDTATVVTGNIAFKQSTVNAADKGLQSAYVWLLANVGSAALYNDNALAGYVSSAPAAEPDWNNPNNWTNAYPVGGGTAPNSATPDAGGNRVYYLIHRLCPVPNCAPGAICLGNTNSCGSTPDIVTVTGEGTDQSGPNFFTRPPAIHYRITARAVGPRNSLTVAQTMMRFQ